MNIQELIKEYKSAPFSIVSINSVLEDLKQLDEPQPIKLKDVIARIENFDLGTKAVWINEILYKLGSDYGLHKYYAGYKQGKFDGSMEREKVTVQQFVADWIKYCKNTNVTLVRALLVGEVDFYNYANQKDFKKLKEFLKVKDNQELFARAWLDGYTVEKEPKYTVKFKATKQYLSNDEIGLHFGPSFRSNFTKSDLEKLGLGWVFDCEGMEVEKV